MFLRSEMRVGFGIVENANRDGTDLFILIHEFSHAMFFDCLQTAACRLCLKMFGVCLGSWRAVWEKRKDKLCTILVDSALFVSCFL